MNQTYIDTVKRAHNLCKEMSELDQNSDEFHKKADAYMQFVLESDTGDWHIPVHIAKIALATYKLRFDARKLQTFVKFADKYKHLIMTSDLSECEHKYFLTEDLLYLSDIQPD